MQDSQGKYPEFVHVSSVPKLTSNLPEQTGYQLYIFFICIIWLQYFNFNILIPTWKFRVGYTSLLKKIAQ